MFLAGVLPGVVFGLLLMLVSGFLSAKRGYGAGEAAPAAEVVKSFGRAILSLFLVVIVLGGILGGVFTATEAAAVAVVYALILGMAVYRENRLERPARYSARERHHDRSCVLTDRDIFGDVLDTGLRKTFRKTASAALLALSDNPAVILLIINAILLAVGVFMDMTPAVLIFTPIFLPVATSLGMHPVHFGMVMIANLCIGLCTPPVGTCLFVGCGVGKTTIAEATGALLPFFGAMLIALAATSFLPELSLWLPRLSGLID